MTFIAGMIAVLPIKLYEHYWDIAVLYFEHINLFTYLQDIFRFPELSRLLSYIIVNGLVALGFFLFIGLLMFVLEVILSRDNTLRIFEMKLTKLKEEPFLFLTLGALFGLVAFLFSLSFFQTHGMEASVSDKVSFFIVVGMLEEFVKHLVLRFSDEEKIHSVDDALSLSIIAALGFAFIENIMYLHTFMISEIGSTFFQILIFFLLRSTISVLAHVSFSAILGYFYGVAHFSDQIVREEVFRIQHSVIIKINQILHLKKSVLFHEEKMMEGMLLAMVAHAIFNALLNFNQMSLVILFLLTLFFFVFSLFHRKNFHEEQKQLFMTYTPESFERIQIRQGNE